MTLTEFLLARIAEDEAAAERAGPHNGGATFAKDNYGCLLVQPARVLAECEAKRRIVTEADKWLSRSSGPETSMPERALLFLALPYAGHPDFREEWGA